jgi:O-methyltransferase involved in polyketide biosynthesis
MGNIPHTAPVTSTFVLSQNTASPRFDPSVPHLARVYAYWLGGKDHSPADRKVAEEVLDHRPQVVAGARANRDFLARVVEYLAAEAGIRQFLDIGAGLPAPGCTHQIAHAIAADSRIVYVDHDPLVLAHARALLTGAAGQGTVACVEADVRDPAAVLAAAAATLDFSRPVAVLLLAILHFLPGSDDPAGIIATLASGLAPGSYLAVSHVTADFAPQEVAAGVQAYNNHMPTPVVARTHRQVSGLFGNLPLVAPGVVPVSGWRPRPLDALPVPADLYAGAGRIARGRRP